MLRVYRDIVRDAARATGAPLVQVLVCRDGDASTATSAAIDGAAAAGERGGEVAALLAQAAGAIPARLLEANPGRTSGSVPCEPALARLLAARGPDAAGTAPGRAWSTFFRIGGEGHEVVLLRFVSLGRARAVPRRALAAVARLAAGRLEADRARHTLAGHDVAYRVFQQSAGEAMLVVDPVSGRVLEANEKLCELTGTAPAMLRRLTLGRLIAHPDLDDRGLLARLTGERLVREDEVRLRRRDGEPLPVAVTAARVALRDRSVLHVIVRDVSRERRTLAALRQAKETLTALHVAGAHLTVETDEEAIHGVLARELGRLGFHAAVLAPADEQGTVYAWRFASFPPALEREIEQILGRALREIRIDAHGSLLGRCVAEVRTVYSELSRAAVSELLGGAAPEQLKRLNRLVGLRRVILAPLRRGERVSGVLAVAAPRLHRDDAAAIDAFALQTSIALEKARLIGALKEERARLESEVDRRTRELQQAVRALEETDRRKDAFLANVSHELRTPLVTVLGYADLLLGEKLGEIAPRQRTALGVVAQSARRLKSFIDELLEFSRHELTKGAYAFAAFDLRDLVTQAAMALAPRFAERGVRVRARVSRRTPPVWGDRERVLQVLVNLLGNAERYAPEGSAVFIVAARRSDGRVEVAVTDRGGGIPEEHVPHIFDRLYQVRDDRSPRHKGGALGLGLAIVKSIVEAHGGAVTVRSRVGRGTTFRFTLPSVEALSGPTPAAPAPRLQDG